MVTVPNFALQVERTGSIYWQAYFCTVCVYFLFPQHHGNDRFYMTSMGDLIIINDVTTSTCVFNSSKMETLGVCMWRTIVYWWVAGLLLHQSGCERTLLLGGQTSGQQSATRALPRTGRGRLPHTERVITRITQQSLMKSRSLESTAIVFCMDHVVKVEVLILHKHPS